MRRSHELGVSAELGAQVAQAAGHRCGYCRTSERVSGVPLEVEHLVPRSRGGASVLENLWLACRLCNAHKSDRTRALDPDSRRYVLLFDPRIQVWRDHFRWSSDGLLIEGITAVGRATVEALHLNRDVLVLARRVWIVAGVHPPGD